MKFATLLSTAAALFSVSNALNLFVESEDHTQTGKRIDAYHQGAGISYFVLDTAAAEFTYHENNNTLALADVPDYLVNVQNDHVVEVGVLGAADISIQDGYLALNGTTQGFRACDEVDTPYHYGLPVVLFSTENEDFAGKSCTPIKLKVGYHKSA